MARQGNPCANRPDESKPNSRRTHGVPILTTIAPAGSKYSAAVTNQKKKTPLQQQKLSNNCFAIYPNCDWTSGGNDPDYSEAAIAAFNGVEGERSQVTPGLITDGLSNVFFAGEKYLEPDLYYTGTDPADDNCVLQGNDRDTNRWVVTGYPLLRDTRGNQQEYNFGSAARCGREFCLLRWSRPVDKLSDWLYYVSDPRSPELSRG